MHRQVWTWNTSRLPDVARVVRWGHFGTPVLLFPTAGGDFEEVERHGLVHAISNFIHAGRIKVYSIDSHAGRTWLQGHSPEYCSRVQNAYDAFIYEELVPHIQRDCATPGIEMIAAGASIGAFNAAASLCRHPDAFRACVAMSGTFDLSRWLHGRFNDDFYFSSPLHFLPNLGECPQLWDLRRRFIVLATGEGDYEDPGESWRLAHVLGKKGIPNRVDLWGRAYHHEWTTWHQMLPRYLADLT